jgi:hypothetical protein
LKMEAYRSEHHSPYWPLYPVHLFFLTPETRNGNTHRLPDCKDTQPGNLEIILKKYASSANASC